jgi:hypothetical protein
MKIAGLAIMIGALVLLGVVSDGFRATSVSYAAAAVVVVVLAVGYLVGSRGLSG